MIPHHFVRKCKDCLGILTYDYQNPRTFPDWVVYSLQQYCGIKSERKYVLPTAASTAFDRCCRQAPGLVSELRYCCWVLYSGAGVAAVWLQARTQNLCLWPMGSLSVEESTSRGIAVGFPRPVFRSSHTGRAQAPRSATSHIDYGGDTPSHPHGAGRPSLDCLCVRAAKSVSLCLARARHLLARLDKRRDCGGRRRQSQTFVPTTSLQNSCFIGAILRIHIYLTDYSCTLRAWPWLKFFPVHEVPTKIPHT